MIFSVALFTVFIIVEVNGEGFLIEPPARNVMWRFGYKTPKNYNDTQLSCGGFFVHHEVNGGKCGVCGDDFSKETPRDHEAGGLYALGIVARHYVAGQQIAITANLTANSRGRMEVKICPNNNTNKIVTQECLDKHPLLIVGQDNNRFVIPKESKKVETFSWTVQLPEGMTCSQCVIQWTYFADYANESKANNNNNNNNNNNTETVETKKETWINCADVEILPIEESASSSPPSDAAADLLRGSPHSSFYSSNSGNRNASLSEQELKPLVIRSQLCIPVGKHKEVQGMDDWCRIHCLKYPPNCPPEMCKCVHNCEAVGEFAKLHDDADIFCHQNCLKYPSYCPEERCKCT